MEVNSEYFFSRHLMSYNVPSNLKLNDKFYNLGFDISLPIRIESLP